jgi:hypothetical protein
LESGIAHFQLLKQIMMTQDILNTKEELRNLIDAYAYLGDEWKISEVMRLFTEDAVYKVYMGDLLVANVNGTAELEKEFNGHAAQVKALFHDERAAYGTTRGWYCDGHIFFTDQDDQRAGGKKKYNRLQRQIRGQIRASKWEMAYK